jgi:hypothetical protein
MSAGCSIPRQVDPEHRIKEGAGSFDIADAKDHVSEHGVALAGASRSRAKPFDSKTD